MLYKTEWLWELKTWSGKMTLMILQQILPTSSIETYRDNQQMRTYILISGFTGFILIFPQVYLSLLHDSRTGPRRTWKAIFVLGGLKSSRHEMRLCILQNKPYTWEKSVTALCTWDKASHGDMCIYIYIYIYIYILIITGVQASGVIIDRLLRQCCFVWSEIVGPHSMLFN